MKVPLHERINEPDVLPRLLKLMKSYNREESADGRQVAAQFFLADLCDSWPQYVRSKDVDDLEKIERAIKDIQAVLPNLSAKAKIELDGLISFGGLGNIPNDVDAPIWADAISRGNEWRALPLKLAPWLAACQKLRRRIESGSPRSHRFNHEGALICLKAGQLWRHLKGEDMPSKGVSDTNQFVLFLSELLEITRTNGAALSVFEACCDLPPESSNWIDGE